jgi:hypothetical protein
MGLTKVPDERKWTQPNTSVLFGNLHETKNIDFSLNGFVSLAPRTRYVAREDASTASFEHVQSITHQAVADLANPRLYYFLTNDKIYSATTALGSFAVLAAATPPTLTTESDAVTSGIHYIVTSATDINSYTGTWVNNFIVTLGGTALISGVPHPLCYASFNTNIYIGNRNRLCRFTTTSDGGLSAYTASVIVLPISESIVWIRSFNSALWLGTKSLVSGNSHVYQWDGTSASYNSEYEIDCPWVYSGCDWRGNFYIFTADGRLMQFNGAGFQEIARIPAYTTKLVESNYVFGNSYTNGSVHQRGMAVIDGLIHVMVNSEATDSAGVVEGATTKLMSGIWVYDPAVGFYNKYTPSASTSTTNTDFGQMALEDGAGAIAPVAYDPSTASPLTSSSAGTLLYGAKLHSASATNYFTLGSVTTGENRGYFTTSRIESENLQDSWRYVWVKFEEFENATDAIIFRYKTRDRTGMPFSTASNVTWTSNTTFTSTDTGFANVEVGDDVTVMTGDGAGSIANITTISYANPTYTVTLDEAITAVANADVGKVIVNTYHKLTPTVSTATIDGVEVFERYAKISIPTTNATDSQPAPSEWIELKVELRGEKIRISELAVLSETQTFTII